MAIVPHGRHVAPTQLSDEKQLMPQPPQLFGSLLMSAHGGFGPEPHTDCPLGHSHPPSKQAPEAHTLPQTPQLFRSDVTSTHAAFGVLALQSVLNLESDGGKQVPHTPLMHSFVAPPFGREHCAHDEPHVNGLSLDVHSPLQR